MLLEVLVIATCVSAEGGCGEATSAYYAQSKELQSFSAKMEKIGREVVSDQEWAVYLVTPIYSLVTRQPAKFLIYKGTTLSLDPRGAAVGIQWNY